MKLNWTLAIRLIVAGMAMLVAGSGLQAELPQVRHVVMILD